MSAGVKWHAAAALGIAALVAAFSAGNARAESVCKGLTEAECSGNGACGWVKGFTRKNGSEVDAFCRKKPERKKTALKSGPVEATDEAVK